MMKENPCHRSDIPKAPDHITEPLQYVKDLPEEWRWDNIEGKNFLTVIHNQHVPQYCGSCWAQASASALSDRIKIARKGAWPDINIAPQVFVSCSEADKGCNGGLPINAYAYAHENFLTDETCAIYHGRDGSNGYQCSPVTKCRNCSPGKDCFIPDKFYIYKVGDYGSVKGEEAMKQEIFQNGPIACEIAVPEDFYKNYTGGIYQDKTGDLNPVHDISIVGYGVENGVKYWLGRNSWGEGWGENGFFRVIRGINNIAIESNCAFAIPVDTWTEGVTHETTDEERKDPRNDYTNKPSPIEGKVESPFEDTPCRHANEWFGDEETNVPEDVKNFKDSDIPTEIDWRNYNGTNYLSWNKNQHIPIYCGSCWAQGTTSALADRFNIMNWLKNGDLNAPQVALSAQVIVNCEAGGSCNGGQPGSVYRYAMNNGIPHSSCEQYIAENVRNDSNVCSDFNVCRDCSGPVPSANETGFDHCWAINYKHHYASGYRSVKGVKAMKKELATYGPIGCGVHVSNKFEAYTGGIYDQFIPIPMINHEISVVGYGVSEDGTEYWIGRNSWGTYWGEYGFFRIRMHKHNLGIETDCVAAYPTYEAPTHEETE